MEEGVAMRLRAICCISAAWWFAVAGETS